MVWRHTHVFILHTKSRILVLSLSWSWAFWITKLGGLLGSMLDVCSDEAEILVFEFDHQ